MDKIGRACYYTGTPKKGVTAMTLGQRLTELRKKHGLSQDALAEALGVSRQSVSKWETDASVPDLDKLVKLSDLFEITLDELVRGSMPPQTQPQAGWKQWWAQAAALYREKAYLLGWLLVVQGLFHTDSLIDGVNQYYYSTESWAATLTFIKTLLPPTWGVILVQMAAGLLIVLLGRRFAGRFRWYHLGWVPVSAAVLGLRSVGFLHMGLLEEVLWDLLVAARTNQVLRAFSSLLALDRLLVLIFGLLVLGLGKRYTRRSPE